MATRLQVETFRADQQGIVEAARGELFTFWDGLDKSRPDAGVLLQAFMRELVASYGELAAGQAADFFDDVRESSLSARGAYRAVIAEPVPGAAVAASTGWALSTQDVLPNLDGVLDLLVKRHGRDTLDFNTGRDFGARYARVPSGSETCAFCLMLCSRGAAYGGSERSGAARSGEKRSQSRRTGDGNKFHAHCDCVIVPVWSDADLPDGYDPDALYETYRAGVDKFRSGDAKSILAGIRSVTGHSH